MNPKSHLPLGLNIGLGQNTYVHAEFAVWNSPGTIKQSLDKSSVFRRGAKTKSSLFQVNALTPGQDTTVSFVHRQRGILARHATFNWVTRGLTWKCRRRGFWIPPCSRVQKNRVSTLLASAQKAVAGGVGDIKAVRSTIPQSSWAQTGVSTERERNGVSSFHQSLLLLWLWSSQIRYSAPSRSSQQLHHSSTFLPVLNSSFCQHFSRNPQFLIPLSPFLGTSIVEDRQMYVKHWRKPLLLDYRARTCILRPVSSSLISNETRQWLHIFWTGCPRQESALEECQCGISKAAKPC